MSNIAEAAEPSVVAASEDAGWNATNPFFAPSELPFGAPPFHLLRAEHYLAAFEAGMRAQQEEVQAIAHSAEVATFTNTVVALERSGTLLTRVASPFFCVAGAETSESIQQIQQTIAPLLSAHSDSMYLDSALFARVHAIYEQRSSLSLNA